MKKYFLIALLCMSQMGLAQKDYVPSEENLKAREWFENARFGLFVHWGVYSILGDGEWVMNNQNISVEEYNKLPSFFNPIDFDPKAWVQMVKDAGMKYITITSRHHDGFSMFDTEAGTYNIVDDTPYKKDVLKLLADECHKQGIKLFFYYSQLDWHHDDYFPRGRTGNGITGRAAEGDWKKYIDYMKFQLTELLTNYGEIGGIWFDGSWDKKDADWHLEEIYSLIHRLQPHCLIGSNHHKAPNPGEDFQMFEKDLPGRTTKGFATAAEDIGNLPLEVCETINGSWGFNLQDRRHKTKKELIQYIVKAAGYGSNLLLNVGPMPNGAIQPLHVAKLKEMGNWLKKYGETIYGTSGGPITPDDELSMTQKGKTLYLHLLNPDKKAYLIEDLSLNIKKMTYFKSNKKPKFIQDSFGLTVVLDKDQIDPINTIVEVTLE